MLASPIWWGVMLNPTKPSQRCRADIKALNIVQLAIIQRLSSTTFDQLCQAAKAIVALVEQKRILRGQPSPGRADLRALVQVAAHRRLAIRDAYSETLPVEPLAIANTLDADTFKESTPPAGP